MTKEILRTILTVFILFIAAHANAWIGGVTPKLQVKGRYLKDSHGNVVNLHGVAMTPSPWFNGGAIGVWRWNNYDVAGCLKYNFSVMDRLSDTTGGWYLNYVRLHIDPYWTNNPGTTVTGENDISQFNFERLKTTIDQVIVPLIKHAKSRGMYVILRPPGVCPDKIDVGDSYHKYLITVWKYVSQHPDLKNADNVMFELANEPVQILGTDGTWGSNSQAHFDKLKLFFQPIVDTIRAHGVRNIIWIPGTGWQSNYKGYAVNPIEGQDIGYAVHVYPGYWGGLTNYQTFQKGWDENVKPVADFAPIAVTEIDWAPDGYNTWGKGVTGTAGGDGFGANFKKIVDASGNVSWNLLAPEDLIDKGDSAGGIAFNNIPEACANPCYTWFKAYSKVNYSRPGFVYRSHSDNGDGTYTNPLIFADFPDPDVIRVGNIFYMVSTTMHIFPGATILKSYDLVNWEYCSNPLEKIETTSCYNLDGCSHYGHGQWASSLKYNNGTFYLLFTTPDDGSYLLTATDPEGPWVKKKLNDSFYDPGLFFDDDGKIYVVYGIDNLKIAELDSDFKKVAGKDQVVFTYTYRKGLEGSHLYKINGYYYIYSTYGGWPAFQVAMRSKDIYGTYEEKKLLEDNNIHQGALIQTQTGEWWTILFYDKGAYGRLPNLQPVNWVDNWPQLGNNGKAVTTFKKPNVGKEFPIAELPTNDNFRDYKLGMQWGWNHNPDNSKWSLTERPGYLRLKTVSVVDSFHKAKNTLTQRIFGFPVDLEHSYGTVKMHISQMVNGDVAGLAVFQDPYAFLGVKVKDGQKQIVLMNNNVQVNGPTITDSIVYLRVVASYTTSNAGFYYSLDNKTYTRLGSDFSMKYNLSVFTGNKFCLFNYATVETGGFVDIDWFTTEKDFSENSFYDNSFTGYSKEALMLTDLTIEGGSSLILLTGSSTSISLKATYADKHTEDVSIGAVYNNPHPEIIQIINGQVIAKMDGADTVTVSYKGALGDRKYLTICISSSTFPLVNGLFNPSIYSQGSFETGTHTLITGTYGFGGWKYTAGVNLSGYKYLVAKLGNDNSSGVSFRVFDESNYWSKAAEYDFGNSRQVVANLAAMYKKGTTTKMDPGHIYFVGFWSYGNSPIVIDSVFLSNSSEYNTATSIPEIKTDQFNENEIVDVYTIMGVKIRSKVRRKDATPGLPDGLYIVGRKKVLVTDGIIGIH